MAQTAGWNSRLYSTLVGQKLSQILLLLIMVIKLSGQTLLRTPLREVILMKGDSFSLNLDETFNGR
jgi:hypothetical protein